MKIHDQHLFHGAALLQLLQDPRYQNNLGRLDEHTYHLGNQAALYLKVAHKSVAANTYQFTFSQEENNHLFQLKRTYPKVRLGLICTPEREICCLPYETFEELFWLRQEKLGDLDPQFWIKVQLPAGKQFRVFTDTPGQKGRPLGDPILIPRSDFPEQLFV